MATFPEFQGFPNPYKQGGLSTSRSLVLLPGRPEPSTHTQQAPTTYLQSNRAVRRPARPIRRRVVTYRPPPKQWEVMQALLNPEFEISAPLLKYCYETYKWKREDAVSFATSGLPEPRPYLVLPIRSRRHQANQNINPLEHLQPDSNADRVGKTDLETSPSKRQESEQSVEVEGGKALLL